MKAIGKLMGKDLYLDVCDHPECDKCREIEKKVLMSLKTVYHDPLPPPAMLDFRKYGRGELDD